MTWVCYFIAMFIGIVVGALVTHNIMNDELTNTKNYERILEREAKDLHKDLDKAIRAFENLSSFIKETPDDCKLGPWCQGCQYSRTYSRYIDTVNGRISSFYCGKKEVCKHFTQVVEQGEK